VNTRAARVVRWQLVLSLLVLLFVGQAGDSVGFTLPNELPDGSRLASTRDVFADIADVETAAQLRSHMPSVIGGTEYRYVLGPEEAPEVEWGIVVFDFADETTALESFQHLAETAATVNKETYFSRIDDAESDAAIQEFLSSDLEHACLMDEIVIFPMAHQIVWVDDYLAVYLTDASLESALGTIRTASSLGALLAVGNPLQAQPQSQFQWRLSR